MSRRPLHNLLVTGGAGFIGSAFVRATLARADFTGTIVNLDALTYAGNLDNLVGLDPARHRFVHGDIRDDALVTRLIDAHAIDAIVHLAAESHVDRSIQGPAAFIETNVVGTTRLLEVVRARPHVHLHHVSTDEVYGPLGPTDPPVSEGHPYRPSSPYAASKAAADHLVRAWARTYGLSTTISHGSNTYGPRQFPEKLIPLMITRGLAGAPLPIYGDGGHTRDWLHVDDHVAAIWRILADGAAGEAYAVGGGNAWTNLALVERLCDEVAALRGEDPAEARARITFVADRPGHDLRYAIDGGKLARALGWAPGQEFAAGLRATIRWYAEHPAWIARIASGAYRYRP